jgi:hypothetical protein
MRLKNTENRDTMKKAARRKPGGFCGGEAN